MSEPVILTEDELRDCCAEWQRVLGLQDWRVIVKLVRFAAYGSEQVSKAGEVKVNNEKREALIRITDPEDYALQCDADFEKPQDMERTLVHELLHLHFAPLWHVIKGDVENRFEEHAVNALSIALVTLKRKAIA